MHQSVEEDISQIGSEENLNDRRQCEYKEENKGPKQQKGRILPIRYIGQTYQTQAWMKEA